MPHAASPITSTFRSTADRSTSSELNSCSDFPEMNRVTASAALRMSSNKPASPLSRGIKHLPGGQDFMAPKWISDQALFDQIHLSATEDLRKLLPHIDESFKGHFAAL